MAAIAAAAFSAVTSAFSATSAAAGATAAAGAAKSSLFSFSTLSTLAQGGLGLVGAMASMRAGDAKAQALHMQADDLRDNAADERIQAVFRRDSLKRQLLQQMGESDVAHAASGLDVSFGTPSQAREQARDDGYRALARDENATNRRAGRYMRRARMTDLAAAGAGDAGSMKALGILGKTGLSIIRRG